MIYTNKIIKKQSFHNKRTKSASLLKMAFIVILMASGFCNQGYSQTARWQMAAIDPGSRTFSRTGSATRAIEWQVSTNTKMLHQSRLNPQKTVPGQQQDWKESSATPAAHTDHLEMSGKFISAIITYGIDSNQKLILKRELIFPMLRTIPNLTGASLKQTFNQGLLPGATENGAPLSVVADKFTFDGILAINGHTKAGLQLEAQLLPSADKAAYLEVYQLTNRSNKTLELQLTDIDSSRETPAVKGVYGAYIIKSTYYPLKGSRQLLAPGTSMKFSRVIAARRADRDPYDYDPEFELKKRQRFLREISQHLQLETPNDTINQMFAFAKIRAAESIFDTKGGLMHGPGGGAYYAALWANDEAEYVSPFFPFLGYEEGSASAVNCYRQFARFMNPEMKPLPSSIIAEGVDVWQGAGDRGDQAMIAYGASRFALAYADSATARRIWPLIKWCLRYLEGQKTKDGVIASNSDELEGRFPSGKVNLSTNCLAYGGYVDGAKLAGVLGEDDLAKNYIQKAADLRNAIEKYFGHTVQGYNTYRYFEGNTKLRSWICLPLVVGINERKDATVKALLSSLLWSKQGILTASGSTTYWDRATLYAFRGLFDAGKTDTCYKYFSYYSTMRLLGEHVPYAVEAWPEGDQRQLSAESGLYCRVVTEGLFGIQPMSFNAFTLQPRLPKDWKEMRLNHVMAFGHDFNIQVQRTAAKALKISVVIHKQTVFTQIWDGKAPLLVTLPQNIGPL